MLLCRTFVTLAALEQMSQALVNVLSSIQHNGTVFLSINTNGSDLAEILCPLPGSHVG